MSCLIPSNALSGFDQSTSAILINLGVFCMYCCSKIIVRKLFTGCQNGDEKKFSATISLHIFFDNNHINFYQLVVFF